ncbi:hypothetical protein BH78_26060 [Pseudomonas aeruginosa C1913C]|nr:hypothetical protein BH78_26060 [Pseudomonas aeruginosa C1913C]
MAAPSGEQEVAADQQPEDRADRVLHPRLEMTDGRPIGLGEGRQQQQHDHPGDQLHAAPGGQPQGFAAGQATWREQRPAELEAGGAGEGDGGQFERAVADDEGPEGLHVADLRQVAGHRTDHQAIEQQEEQAAESQQHAAGEGLKGDADVVHDVEAEHFPVVAGVACPQRTQAGGFRGVHRLHLADLVRADHAVDQVGKVINQQPHEQGAAVEQQAGHGDAAPLLADQARQAGEQEAEDAAAELAAVPVELLVAAHRQLLQLVDQVTAVAALLGQRQLLAEAPVIGGEVVAGAFQLLAFLEEGEAFVEALPGGLVALFEEALFHALS